MVNAISSNIKWIMLVSGVLTCTMLYAAVAPQAALNTTFGDTLSGPLAEIIIRNWGVLIFLIGIMLIYGAFKPVHRRLIITVAMVSKIVFIGLVLTLGAQYLGRAGVSVAFDGLIVVLFIVYLLTVKPSA
jgi:hypothetical protein